MKLWYATADFAGYSIQSTSSENAQHAKDLVVSELTRKHTQDPAAMRFALGDLQPDHDSPSEAWGEAWWDYVGGRVVSVEVGTCWAD
jgi:hypothetical protein